MDVSDLLDYIGPAIGVLVTVVFVVVIVFKQFKPRLSGGTWDAAVQQIAQQFGLRHTPIESFYDQASGNIGKYDVDVSVDVDSEGMGVAYRMKIEIDTSIGWSFLMKVRGTKADWEGDAGQPMPVGDPELDQTIEIRGAPPQLYQVLQSDAQLRALIKQVVGGWGAYLSRDDLVLFVKAIPGTADEIRAYLEPMLELARWLSEPNAPRTGAAVGTAAAGMLGRYDHAPDQEKLPLLHSFMEQLGSTLGPGQAYINTNDEEVDWRGTVNNFPVRIKLDSWPNVEIELKLQHGHGEVDLEFDASKVPEPGAPPPWDESDTVRVFFGKGVFIEGAGVQVDGMLQHVSAMPERVIAQVAEAMARDEVRNFRIDSQRLWVRMGPELTEMLDPEGQVGRTAQVMGWLAQSLQGAPPDPAALQAAQNPQSAAAMMMMKTSCRYCSTMFIAYPDPNCPNCGAPAQAS